MTTLAMASPGRHLKSTAARASVLTWLTLQLVLLAAAIGGAAAADVIAPYPPTGTQLEDCNGSDYEGEQPSKEACAAACGGSEKVAFITYCEPGVSTESASKECYCVASGKSCVQVSSFNGCRVWSVTAG
ncbi:MAG: hypothetical protein J3K34DRAFT_456115, partial [Monoraphidium minutum]